MEIKNGVGWLMAPESVTGLVLSSRNIGETDRRIVLLTREKGKISAFARGAVKPRNPLVSSTQVFTFGEFFVYTGRDSYTVTGAEVKNHFSGLIKDLDKYYYASYLCEIAEYYTRENLDASEELLLLYQALKALEKGLIDNRLVRYIYEWRMLYLQGEYPDVMKCAGCDSTEKIAYFDMTKNIVFCEKCGNATDTNLIKISPATLYSLQYILTSNLKSLFAFSVKDEIMTEVEKLSKDYLKKVRNVTFNSEIFIDGGLGLENITI